MRVPLFKRLIIAMLNIFFPPLAVMLLCGPNQDCFINSILFLLAVIPSHVHGFYISMTYFNRKRKARRGVYPGRKRGGIYSEKVNTGGVGWREAEKLKIAAEGEKTAKSRRARKAATGSGSGSGSGSGWTSPLSALSSRSPTVDRVEEWDDGSPFKEVRVASGRGNRRTVTRATSGRAARRERTRYYDDEVDY